MTMITKPPFLDSTGQLMANSLSQLAETNAKMVDVLNLIAVSQGGAPELTNWRQIQTAVASGNGPRYLPVGTQLQVGHSVYGTHLFDVVAHDYLKSSRDPNAHTMTLLQHDLLSITTQYDASQAFYYAAVPLAAGTYNVTLGSAYSSWEAGTYQFTLSQEVPAGGQLCVSGYASTALTSLNVVSYSSQTSTTPLESVPISTGSGGTSLGTFGEGDINNIQRVSYGSNNYKESAIRQLLNSTDAAGSVWTPHTMFDRPPAWASTVAGYAGGLDPDFLSVVTPVALPCSANNVYEAPDSTITKGTQYTLEDTLYLVSRTEVFGTSDVTDGSVLLPYFDGATDTDRVKYRNNSAAYWWLRTPYSSDAYSVRIVFSDGTLSYHGAYNSCGLAPACTIA